MRTNIYIDGFNFYYGSVKGTPFKWLDFRRLFEKILARHHQILSIKYFTALVSPTPNDPHKQSRQRTYIRALEASDPDMQVHYGFFLRSTREGQLLNPSYGRTREKFVKVEEKGSDVNLSLHLYRDAWLNSYDCAVVVSNDSDLAEAMRLVKEDFGKTIGLVTPGKKHTSGELKQRAKFVRRIRTGALANSQLPNPIPGTNIFRPSSCEEGGGQVPFLECSLSR